MHYDEEMGMRMKMRMRHVHVWLVGWQGGRSERQDVVFE